MFRAFSCPVASQRGASLVGREGREALAAKFFQASLFSQFLLVQNKYFLSKTLGVS